MLPTRHVLVTLTRLATFGVLFVGLLRPLEHRFELLVLLLGETDTKGADESSNCLRHRILGVSFLSQLYWVRLLADQGHVG